jgi:3-dehydroquinate dehydratase II
VARAILVINGPNLNLLGTRETHHYGTGTLADIERELSQTGAKLGLTVQTFQSNHEGGLIDRIHAARADGTDFIIINAGAFTHTSIALRDALAAVAIPFVEVHLSNVHAREAFRRQSYFSDLAVGVIAGFGANSYAYALSAAIDHLRQR